MGQCVAISTRDRFLSRNGSDAPSRGNPDIGPRNPPHNAGFHYARLFAAKSIVGGSQSWNRHKCSKNRNARHHLTYSFVGARRYTGEWSTRSPTSYDPRGREAHHQDQAGTSQSIDGRFRAVLRRGLCDMASRSRRRQRPCAAGEAEGPAHRRLYSNKTNCCENGGWPSANMTRR